MYMEYYVSPGKQTFKVGKMLTWRYAPGYNVILQTKDVCREIEVLYSDEKHSDYTYVGQIKDFMGIIWYLQYKENDH